MDRRRSLLRAATARRWRSPRRRARPRASGPTRTGTPPPRFTLFLCGSSAAGAWLDFNNTLQRLPDGTITPRVHPHDLRLAAAGDGGERDLATVGVGGERFGLGWSGRLPEPTLAGSKAAYPEVLPGVDLVIEATSGGFEQFFIVKEKAAAARVAGLTLPMRGRFSASAGGTGQWQAGDGRLVACWASAGPHRRSGPGTAISMASGISWCSSSWRQASTGSPSYPGTGSCSECECW